MQTQSPRPGRFSAHIFSCLDLLLTASAIQRCPGAWPWGSLSLAEATPMRLHLVSHMQDLGSSLSAVGVSPFHPLARAEHGPSLSETLFIHHHRGRRLCIFVGFIEYKNGNQLPCHCNAIPTTCMESWAPIPGHPGSQENNDPYFECRGCGFYLCPTPWVSL